jgi:CO/xanthine dehydrogenase FAD-binding subunit
VVGGSGPVPSRCLGAESVLDRQRGDDASPHTAMPSTLSAAAAEAAAEAAREIEASDDGLASEWYRRRIVEVLVRDALLDAVGRTREPAPEAGV